ncbi:hypothetical protein NQZ79_g1292 [Umbelopsis isabellina]|nr:hypothetical protein NQZ79_g1292 [Umbelopsis isabellina]
MEQPSQQGKSRSSVQMYVPKHKRADAEAQSPTPNRDDSATSQSPEVSKSSARRGRGKFQAPSDAEDVQSSIPGRDIDQAPSRTDDQRRASRSSKHKSLPAAERTTDPNERRRSRVTHDDYRSSLSDVDKLGDSMANLSTGPQEGSDDGQREEWEDLLKEYDHYETPEHDSPRTTLRKKRLSSHIDLFSAPAAEAPIAEEPTTVLDCYDFPPAFKTHHLHDIFREYENLRGGYRIKWLEDTRALIIFEHPSTDNVSNPLAKIRPYSGPMNSLRSTSQGTVPRRPATTDMVARRLVHGALGVRAPSRSKEQRQAEKDVLKSARDEQKAKKQQDSQRANQVAAAFDE